MHTSFMAALTYYGCGRGYSSPGPQAGGGGEKGVDKEGREAEREGKEGKKEELREEDR